ncbi:MAG: DUF350 domain-containing protein [Polyangiaceae bacterium]|jgi:uncharacterized membrane protein YjfL (UPF0719 family)|nr:DUF350 domain-containing protein [Polyangiaceae bacterium]
MTQKLTQLGVATAITLVLLGMSLLGQRLVGRSLQADLDKGNTARGLLQVGHVLGVFLIVGSIVANSVTGEDLTRDALWALTFGGASVLLLEIAGSLGLRLLLRSRLLAEIERGNAAAGLAAGAHYTATGILISKNLHGTELAALPIALVFFVLAQASFHLFVVLFRALTVYDDSEEILGENMGAALSYAGLVVGVGLVVGNASEGQFTGWASSLKGYALALLWNLAFYPVRQLIVQTLLLGARPSLRGGRLDVAIGQERNAGLGALEACCYIATALLLAKVM